MDPSVEQQDQTQAAESPTIQETEKLDVFMKRFYDSQIYKDYFQNFEAGRISQLPNLPQLPIEHRQKIFENSSKGADAIFDFYKNKCRYTYNPMNVPPEVREKINIYIKMASEWSKVFFGRDQATVDEMTNADRVRSSAHQALGAVLVDSGLVSTYLQGKFMGHVILSSLGIEKPPESPQRTSFEKANLEARRNMITAA